MVSKCANPECNNKFTYFGTGELLVKTSPISGHQELFWLCQRCAADWAIPDDLVPLPPKNKKVSARTTKRAAA